MSKVRTGEDRRTKQASQSQQSPRNGDTIFKEDLQASRKIERFTIPLDNLKMMFERPSRIVVMPRKSSRKKEAEIERSLRSPAPKKQTGNYSSLSKKDSNKKGGRSLLTNMSEDAKDGGTAGITRTKKAPSEDAARSGGIPLDLPDSLPIKDRMAMYQAAATSKEQTSSRNMLEESEACVMPGGLASMKKHFEKSDNASTRSSVSQYQHRAVKETRRSNEVTFTSSSQAAEQHETQFSACNTEQVSVHEQSTQETSTASNYNQEADGVGYMEIPKMSAQVLKEQYEKSLKEKSTSVGGATVSQGKHTKIYNDHPEFEWPVVNTTVSGSASSVYDGLSSSLKSEHAAKSSHTKSVRFGSLEEFPLPPPPPPDILEREEIADFSQSPEPPNSTETYASGVPKEVYSKQRNLYELKRLYKHIHPEVRKNLEREYINQVSDIVTSQYEQKGEVQHARSVFENPVGSPQKCLSPEREYLEWDEILKGEVQSMRWVFENQPLDTIKDESPEQSHIKSIGEQEIIAGGDVKYTTWMFETQPIHALGVDPSNSSENVERVPELARGDVRTATWLFETQPLDALNKMYKENDSDTVFSSEDIHGGDVKAGRYFFETQYNDGSFSSDEMNMLRLKSELQEFKGDVKTTVQQFETEPKYVLQDSSGKVLAITTISREDIEKGDVKTARWMFETQPLDMINQDKAQVKVVKGISMEESVKGGVGKAKWLFETRSLDLIKEEDDSVTQKEAIIGADVYQKCWIFETLPMDILKDNANERPLEGEEIIGGNVSNTKYLFENVPMDELKEDVEVGKLKQVITTEEEKGDVRHQRWVFETRPLEQIREEKKDYIRTVHLDEIQKGDVGTCRNAFEREDWQTNDFSYKIQIEDVDKGAVQLNKELFETTPLYAIQDQFGHYHEVKTIRKEEVVKGDVRSYQWMFETTPIDQFGESVENYQVIRGISSQEIQSGDVKKGKWLFETQPLDSIKYFSHTEDEELVQNQRNDIVKGDVRTCKWLFETQPMQDLYEKQVTMTSNEEIQKGDVKTCTWLFETQALDAIQDESERSTHLEKEEVIGRDVQSVCFLFETQNLEQIQGEEKKDFKRVVEIDVQSGDVSSMKYIFENQALDQISSNSQEVLQMMKNMKSEDLQKGNVLNCRWLFENQSMDEINENHENNKEAYTITDVQGGNVRKGCFIFETFSLDQIKEESSESTTKTVDMDEILGGDVKNYTMMFETQPLYAIQDKEGFYHEVTTVKKEEVLQGNVRGTRWLFETKPLDSFNDSNEVFVIKAVTQEDIQRGDVSSVRWRFETHPLDKISVEENSDFHTIENIIGGDVRGNRELFETEKKSHAVRTVSISEIQQGNVKTSTWLFETHTLDELHDENYEGIKKVTMEDIQKGDVQESVWLFENQNLDSIREIDETNEKASKEEIPQADVRTTTWLFETTPMHEFNEYRLEKEEVLGKSIHETLKELYSQKIVKSNGIILEADEIGDIRMAKFQLMNQEIPRIEKQEIIRGDLQNIMMNLLSQQSSAERTVLLNEEEKGNINLTKSQLMNQSTDLQAMREDVIGGDIQEAMKNLLRNEDFVKQGILIEESEKGDIKMTIYSLFNKDDSHDFQRDEVVAGDIKRAIYNLKSSVVSGEKKDKVRIEDSERGNVQFFTTCIESGALDYIKRLHGESEDIEMEHTNEEILGGDVEGTKLLLKRQRSQVERTVDETDIIPGDVYNTVKVFMTETENKSFDANKEEIVKGNLQATLSSLSQAINQAAVVEKEEIIKADLPATLKSLTESQYQVRDTEKPDVIPGDIQGTIDSLGKAVKQKNVFVKEEVVQGNVEAALKSLKEAQKSLKQIEKDEVLSGDISATKQSLLDCSTERNFVQHQVSIQGDVKGTMKTLLQPSSQTVQRRASTEGKVKDTIKTFVQSSEENHELSHTRSMAGGKVITEGIDTQQISTIDQRSLQNVNSLQSMVSDTKVDHERTQNINAMQQKVTSMSKAEQREFYNSQKASASKAWKSSNTISDTQIVEFPEVITVGIDTQQISKIDQRSLQNVNKLQHKDTKVDHKSTENINAMQQKVTSMSKAEQREFYNSQKASASKAWKNSNTGSETQIVEFPEVITVGIDTQQISTIDQRSLQNVNNLQHKVSDTKVDHKSTENINAMQQKVTSMSKAEQREFYNSQKTSASKAWKSSNTISDTQIVEFPEVITVGIDTQQISKIDQRSLQNVNNLQHNVSDTKVDHKSIENINALQQKVTSMSKAEQREFYNSQKASTSNAWKKSNTGSETQLVEFPEVITVGIDTQQISTIDQRSLQNVKNLQHKDTKVDHTSTENINALQQKVTSMSKAEQREFYNSQKASASKAWKNSNTISDTQIVEFPEEQSRLHELSKRQKEKSHRDLINQNKVMNQTKLVTNTNTSRTTIMDVTDTRGFQKSDQAQKQVTNQQFHQSNRIIPGNRFNVQHAQVLDTINNNVDIGQKEVHSVDKISLQKETQNIQNKHVITKKAVQEMSENSKTISTRGGHQLTKNIKSATDREDTLISFPPPPPTLLQPSVPEPSLAPTPPPPPPPPPPPLPTQFSHKAYIEPDYFPSPPPPIEDKMDNDTLPPPPETPPPIIKYKEQNKESSIRKTGFQSHEQSVTTSQESKTQFNRFSAEQSTKELSRKYTDKEKSKNIIIQGPDVIPKSKLPIFHTKSGTMSSTKVNESKAQTKQSKASECEQIINISQSHSDFSEKSEFHKDIATNNNVSVNAKQRMSYSPAISPALKTQTLSSDSKAFSQEQVFNKEIENFSQSTAQDYDQIVCDQELERIHEESLRPKKQVIHSSPTQNNVTQISKHNTKSIEVSQVNESKTSVSGTMASIKAENVNTTQLSEQDLEQLTCDRELERIHEETLKPKRKLFTPCRMSPAIYAETPTPKSKTYVRKFKTPLMIAEEKYRQQREELEKNKNKTVSQVYISTSPGTQRKQVSAETDSIRSLSTDSSKIAVTPTKEVMNTQYQVKAKTNIVSSEATEESFNKNKHNVTQLVSSSPIISSNVPKGEILSKETKLIQQQSSQVYNESSAQDHTSKHVFTTVEKSKQMGHSEMTRTSSPKTSINIDRESLETSKPVQAASNIEGMKHIDHRAAVMRQKVHEESQTTKRTENRLSRELKIQSMTQSSEEKQIENTSNSQAVSNEKETKMVQILGLGGTITKTIESPKLQRKLQINKDQINSEVEVKQNISATAGQTEKTKNFSKHQVHQYKSPLPPPPPPHPKQPLVASERVAKNSVTEEKFKETAATKESLEQNLNIYLESQNIQEIKSSDVIEYLRKCEELQQTVSNARKLESDPQTLNINTFRTFLSVVPTWLMSQEKKKNLADLAASRSVVDITEQVSYIKNHAMDMKSTFEGNIQSAIRSSSSSSSLKRRNETNTQSEASQKQITTVAKKVETASRQRKISNDLGRLPSDMKQTDIRACSPLLKMRSPSPSYITIESTVRRNDSPLKDRIPSSSPLPKEPVTIPLPPRRSTTPKTSSPSPQKSRSEQLAKLKDTTVKLSQGTTQPRAITPIPVVVEKKCEIIHSPATMRRQLKIESHTKESLNTTPVPAAVTMSTVEDRTEIYEESRLSKTQQTHSEKDPTHIPKWLGPDMDTLDVISVSQKPKLPTDHVFEAKTKNVYVRDEENLQRRTMVGGGSEGHMAASTERASSHFRTPSSKFQSEQKKAVPKEGQRASNDLPSQGKARTVPIRQIRDHRENTSKQIFVNRHDESQEHFFKPMIHPETILQASGVEKMDSKVTRSRTSQNAEGMKTGFEFKHAPPTYEDVISGHMLDITATESPEEILKNFQKTWEESERVFKSLGYTVSDTSEVISSYHQEEYRTENASSGKGNVHRLSKEGLPNGVPGGRQADFS